MQGSCWKLIQVEYAFLKDKLCVGGWVEFPLPKDKQVVCVRVPACMHATWNIRQFKSSCMSSSSQVSALFSCYTHK